MTRYGFVIDQRRCIGCHACTVACKAEHRVPLGMFRTWVKYVEKGTFPDTRRFFSVLRCNHCERAPCVAICPTRALFRRDDGIVDFDAGRCIGCKSCMQACPYDALYVDPETSTAAKCNFCAHRVEGGMAPACEVVCPTGAIVSGNLDDPASRISVLVATEPVAVRAPEQGTEPKVFYVGADGAAITPEAVRQGRAYLWTEIVPDAQTDGRAFELAREATTVSNVAHAAPWGWKVSSYLATKSVAAGVAGVALLAWALGHAASGPFGAIAPLIAFLFAAITGVLLIWDLKRPARFLFIFTKPNPGSWLVWGGWVLAAFSGALIGWAWGDLGGPGWARDVGRLAAVPAAPLAAAYSGWLLNQAEGRDLWQSRLLHLHLLVLAALAGAGALGLASAVLGGTEAAERLLAWVLTAAGVAHGIVLVLEHARRGATGNAATAARNLVRGRFAGSFWAAVAAAVVVAGAGAGAFLATGARPALWVAAAGGVVGVWLYEGAWIGAGQSAPLS